MARDIEFRQVGESIVIDGERFDWDLDEESIEDANRHANTPEFMRAIHADIMGHFLNSLEAVLGFRPTMKQVNDALEKGAITR
jgi:hypothetical protein